MEDNSTNLKFDNRPEPLTQGVIRAIQAGLELELAWLRGDIGVDPFTELVEKIEAKLRKLLNLPPDYRLIITSSQFESINTAIKGVAWGIEGERNEIAIVRGDQGGFVESAAWCDRLGFKTTHLTLNFHGEPELNKWKNLISQKTALVGLSSITPEVHVKRDVPGIVSVCRENGAISVIDYSEQCSAEMIDFDGLTPDMVSMDCASFGAPIGVSVSMVSPQVRYAPMITGDILQDGLRSGRISFSLLSGLSVSLDEQKNRISHRKHIIDGLFGVATREFRHHLPDIKILALKHNLRTGLLLFVPEVEGEALVLALETINIYLTTGSSCSRAAGKPSQTLIEMGYSERDVSGAIHLSFKEYHTEENIVQSVTAIARTISELWRTAGYDGKK